MSCMRVFIAVLFVVLVIASPRCAPFSIVPEAPLAGVTEETINLYLTDIDGNPCTRLTSNSCPEGIPAISPDGREMIFARNGSLYRRLLNNPEAQCWLAAAADGSISYASPCYVPDGSAILFIRVEHTPRKPDRSFIATRTLDGKEEWTIVEGANPRFVPGEFRSIQNSVIVLHSPRGGRIICKGGFNIGLKEGMILITTRRGYPTGILILEHVEKSECIGVIVSEQRVIAGGDRGLPLGSFFTYNWTNHETGMQRIGMLPYPRQSQPGNVNIPDVSAVFYAKNNMTCSYPDSTDIEQYAFSIDGKLRAYMKTDAQKHQIFLFDPLKSWEMRSTQDKIPLTEGSAPTISPDGQQIAFLNFDGHLMLMNADGTEQRCLLNAPISQPIFTRDGRMLLYLRDGQLSTYNLNTGQHYVITRNLTVTDYRLCPDGRHILLIAGRKEP